jgi:hypothetical protein
MCGSSGDNRAATSDAVPTPLLTARSRAVLIVASPTSHLALKFGVSQRIWQIRHLSAIVREIPPYSLRPDTTGALLRGCCDFSNSMSNLGFLNCGDVRRPT